LASAPAPLRLALVDNGADPFFRIALEHVFDHDLGGHCIGVGKRLRAAGCWSWDPSLLP
jgi:hypothetical protein